MFYIWILIPLLFIISNNVQCNYAPEYKVGTSPRRGMGFKDSVAQAKRQLFSFYARDVPVKDSISKIEDYYKDLKEENLKNGPHKSNLVRKPCKVLPDPQPGLVNFKLVNPVYRYHPIHKREKFYGKFAPLIKYEYRSGPNPIANSRYNYPAAYPNYSPNFQSYKGPKAYPAADPFYGYRAKYPANNDYFEARPVAPIIVVTQTEFNYITPTTPISYIISTLSVDTSSWQSQLSVDYSLRLASMSSLIIENSEVLSSLSASDKLVSLSLSWASKEASLRSKLSSYSITATKTRRRRR